MTYVVPHFINGQAVSTQGRKLDIFNPALGEVIGQITVADRNLVADAVKAAIKAFSSWSAKTVTERVNFLFNYKNLLEKELDPLAALITEEHGKTLNEARGSLRRGIDVLDFALGAPQLLKGIFTENVAKEMDCYSLNQPLGVCAGITPFNFPAMIPLWMFPLAIACGNTFILKPSEKDPSCALQLVQLLKKAGVPDGVVNVLHGDKETVDAILTHPQIKAISFVGSTLVAEQIQQAAILNGKRVQAFGGAKNHCIVMPDVDLDQVAPAILASAYGSAGERCMAISVVVAVGDQVADALVAKMKPLISQLKMGRGTDPDTELGPLITKAHLERVQTYLKIGQEEGAKLVLDGSSLKVPALSQGFFMGGSLFDYVGPHMRIYKEEIFGPVLCVMRVKDFATGLRLINEHEYGNGTSIYTSDGYTARYFAEHVQVGMVGVNVPIPVPVAYQSFGGWKRSIFSDVGMYGTEGVRFYTKLKTVTQRFFRQG